MIKPSMENRNEILNQAIEKARLKGFNGSLPIINPDNIADDKLAEIATKNMQLHIAPIIIYSHDFARAFFGDDIVPFVECRDIYDQNKIISVVTVPAWQAYLQRMVISPDPILYLKNFL